MFSKALVSLLLFVSRNTKNTSQPNSQYSVKRWQEGPWKKPIGFGDNPNHVTLGLGLW